MPAWHILVMSLPTQHTTERMRVWRALKAIGCGVLRDGVYLLPAVEGAHALLERQAAAVIGAGGHGHVLALDAGNGAQEDAFRRLFERSADYAELKIAIDSLRRKLKRGPLASLAREGTQLRDHWDGIAEQTRFSARAGLSASDRFDR